MFPFITTCLFIGASLDDKGDFAPACQIQPLPISTDIYDIPNDDGISIYDITVAPHIRYAFAWINDPAAASTICSAWKYFTDYEDVEAANGIPSSFWDEFKKSPLIEIPDLESAWPGSKFRNTANDVTTTITAADVVAESFSKMSLREKAMSDVITNALHSDPADLSWIEHAEQMPDFAATVGAKFIAEPSLIHLPSGVAMLARYTFKDSVQLDLTPFLDITAEEVLQLMKLVTEGAADKKTCHELLLPDMTSLRAVDLKSIAHLGNITSLHLGTTPLIKLTALLKAIAGTSVKEFTHPLLYSRCFELTQGAQFARPERSWAKAFPCGTGTNFPLRQMVYVTSTEQNSSMRRLRSVGLAWSHKAAGSDRSKPLAIALPLEDALLSTSRLVQTIHLMLTKLVTASASDLESCFSASCVGTGIAKRIAIDVSRNLELSHYILPPVNDYS